MIRSRADSSNVPVNNQICVSLREKVVEHADEGDAREQFKQSKTEVVIMYYSCYELYRRHERDMQLRQ